MRLRESTTLPGGMLKNESKTSVPMQSTSTMILVEFTQK
jgi:hypothetical protein